MGEIALIGSYTYKKFIPKDIKSLGADEKSAHPAVIFRADFCKDGAGNTSLLLTVILTKKSCGLVRRGYVLPQENFCSDKARAAGNTSRIVKGADKIVGEIALIGSYTYKKFIPKDIKTLGADEKSAHPAVIFRADFCKDGAGNTLAVLSSRTHKKVFT